MDLLQKIKLVWTQYRTFQATLAELNSYSDHKLDELGITRADIPRIEYAEAERRADALVPSRPAAAQPAARPAPAAA